jgi:hypothetical protein
MEVLPPYVQATLACEQAMSGRSGRRRRPARQKLNSLVSSHPIPQGGGGSARMARGGGGKRRGRHEAAQGGCGSSRARQP